MQKNKDNELGAMCKINVMQKLIYPCGIFAQNTN